jgi:hypothetical protein
MMLEALGAIISASSGLFAFLGGSAFRMLWGEVSAFVTKRQEHKHELERMRLQGDLDAAQHDRNLKAITVQAELGVKTIEVAARGEVDKTEALAFLEAVRATNAKTGIAIIDAWNAAIRPAGASWALAMLTASELGAFKISETTASVCFAFLGLFVADRALGKRGR